MLKMKLFDLVRFGPEDESGAAGAGDSKPAGDTKPEGEAKLGEAEPKVEPDENTGEANSESSEAKPKAEAKQAESKPSDWRDKRIAQLTARLKESQAKVAQLGEAKPAEGEAPAGRLTEAEVEARAEAKAQALAAQRKFNDDCNAAAEAGRTAYGREAFNDSISKLTSSLVDTSDTASVQAYNELLLAALETGEAPRLLYELGQNLDEAERILSLSPTRRAVELTKLALREPEKISQAPKPINPIGNRGASHSHIEPDDVERGDRLSTAEWMKRRNEQVAKRVTRH